MIITSKNKKEWNECLKYYNITLPSFLKEKSKLIEFHTNGKIYKARPQDHKIVIFKEPVYVDKECKFRLLARYPEYAISKDGIIMLVDKKITINRISSYFRSHLYPSIKIFDSSVKQNTVVFIHRLVALAWCENDNYLLKPIVNHKDKNRHNYKSSNLEWVNLSGNTRHMLNQSLSNIHYGVGFKIRNINTNEILYFTSLTLATNYIGRSRITTRHTPLDKDKIWKGVNGEFEIKYDNDDSPWCVNEKFTTHKKRNVFTHVRAKNIETGKEYKAKTIAELSLLIDIPGTTISKILGLNNNKRVCKKYIFTKGNEELLLDNLIYAENLSFKYYVYKNKELINTFNSMRDLSIKQKLNRHFLMVNFTNKNEITYKDLTIIKKYD